MRKEGEEKEREKRDIKETRKGKGEKVGHLSIHSEFPFLI